jgi:hypothetical protein
MDCSDTGASPAGEAGRTAVVGGAGERETNASSRLAAPVASGRRETKKLCPMDTAESTGARQTTVPEERSAAVRRDGEPLTSAAKRRRQTETEIDAGKPQTDAGERPPSPTREDEEEPPPLGEDPAGQEVTATVSTGREGGIHENSESIKRFEEILRKEARGMLTGYLRDGTEYLSASTVRRVVQVASMSVVGSAIAVTRLDKEVRRVTRRTRRRIRSQTTWCECVRRRSWTGCERELCIRAQTQIPILREVRQARNWLMT